RQRDPVRLASGGSLRLELYGDTSDRLPSELNPHTPDQNNLAKCLNHGRVHISKDASLRIKGAQLGVAVQDYRADTAPTHQVRQGVVEHQVDSDNIDRLFEEGKITLEGVESVVNEFVVLRSGISRSALARVLQTTP